MMVMKEAYYRLLLEDSAAPISCQASKAYYGPQKEIGEIAFALRKNPRNQKKYAGLLDAYERYESGDYLATHTVAGQQVPLLVPLEVVDRKKRYWQACCWTHMDAKGRPHPMRCRKLDATHLWLVRRGEYVRCVQVVFDGLEYQDPNGVWVSVYGNIKANRYMVVANKRLCFNKLAVEEKRFADWTQMEYDRTSFCQGSDINLAGLCDDIFGRS